jgi:hypothetical protein
VGLEELGIPGVSIVQKGFVADAKATAMAYRLINPSLAVTPYVFTALNAPQTRQAADAIIEDIINGLTKVSAEPKGSVIERIPTRGPDDDVLEFRGKDYKECFEKMNDAFLDWGWSDGFPLIPATKEAVEEMLRGTNRPPDETIVEHFVPGMAQATVKNIAINAVMAGCKREFLPVIIAAVEAMHDPAATSLRLCTMSTGPHAPLFVINGPIVNQLHINSGLCALGPAGPERLSFSNIVIGRAVRLILMNVGNCYPGIMDQDTIGSPAKFSMVVAENEKANPWDPYHVEKGFASEDSTVSCFYGGSLTEMCDLESDSAEGLMNTFARHLTGIGAIGFKYLTPVILMAPDHATVLARDGWTKEDVRQYLHLHCRISAETYRRSACVCNPPKKKWLEAADSQAMVHLYGKPEDIQIVVVGGMSGQSAGFVSMDPANPHSIKG